MKASAVRNMFRHGRRPLAAMTCAVIIFAGVGARHVNVASAVVCPPPGAGPVKVVNASTGCTVAYATIQLGVTAATPNDTVIVGPGQYNTNVVIPSAKHDITVRSSNGSGVTTIIGTIANFSAVVRIEANGVKFGGPSMGFTVENSPATALATATDVRGIAVGGVPGLSAAIGNSNDRVVGNRVTSLVPSTLRITATTSPATTGRVMGISAEKSPNVLISGNVVNNITFQAVSPLNPSTSFITGFGIQLLSIPVGLASPNSGSVDHNIISGITESGGACPGTVMVAIALNDNSSNVVAARNTVYEIRSSCRSVGIGSSAVPGPITIERNQILHLFANVAAGGSADGVGLKPGANPAFSLLLGVPTDTVMLNDINTTDKAVAVGSILGFSSVLSGNSVVEYNNFKNSPQGLDNAGAPGLNATNNYWGCPAGPFGGAGCGTIVGAQAGTTLYFPFLLTVINPLP